MLQRGIGEAISKQTLNEQPLIQLAPIESEMEPIVNSNVISDLSTDQCNLYEYCIDISKDYVSEKFVSKKPGPVFCARWLTFALRIMMVYVRTEEPSVELLVITKHVVQVNSPIWFGIKRSRHYKNAPKSLHKTIK